MTAVFFVVGWGYGRELVQGVNVGVRPLAISNGVVTGDGLPDGLARRPKKGWHGLEEYPCGLRGGHGRAVQMAYLFTDFLLTKKPRFLIIPL